MPMSATGLSNFNPAGASNTPHTERARANQREYDAQTYLENQVKASLFGADQLAGLKYVRTKTETYLSEVVREKFLLRNDFVQASGDKERARGLCDRDNDFYMRCCEKKTKSESTKAELRKRWQRTEVAPAKELDICIVRPDDGVDPAEQCVPEQPEREDGQAEVPCLSVEPSQEQK
jgi:hypothetical protein